MSDFNKKNGELDFSNIKQSQFGMGNVIRASFSELQSGLRTLDTNAILKDAYTHFTQTLNVDGLPTFVEYWQATSPAKYEITFVADVASSLQSTYIIFEEFISKRTILLYYNVSGGGVAPGIADEEYPVNILTNDSAFIVALETFNVMKTLPQYFTAKKVGGALYTKVEMQFTQFGEASPLNLGTTGFSSTQTKIGTSFKVGEVYLDYDVSGSPIYNGNTLKGLLYNPYTASFDVERAEVTATVDLDKSSGFSVTNIAVPSKDTEVSIPLPDGTKRFKIQVREPNTQLTITNSAGGDVFTVRYGAFYEESGIDTVSATLYVETSRDTRTIELLTWS